MARLQQCPCGSGEFPDEHKDGYGIFMCYACSKCEDKKLAGFRPDIRQRYDTDDRIEPEDF